MQFKSEFESPWARPEPALDVRTGAWRFQRPVTKTGKCRQCGQCFLYCPAGCVEAKKTHFAADLDFCKGCGLCAKMCPARAIMLVRENNE
jgi:2-oxoacid:acceptor oxidoreductase delta subunit (pyruvate/2-ketoisovalerate family)